MWLIWLIIIIIVCVLLVKYAKYKYKFGVVNMINGGVKSGKTNLVVYGAIKSHRKALLKYYIRKPFMKLKHKQDERPLIYSNIPIKSKYYVPLTNDIIRRDVRIRYGSSVILSEVSLVANSMSYKDELLNEQIELFIKLFGHETHNGTLWIDTQALGDNHYSIKRSIDTSTWIEKNLKIPFFMVYFIHRLNICDEQNVTNQVQDTTQNTHLLIVPKSNWKKYDRFCYSIFTDNKVVIDQVEEVATLKAVNVPTFRKFRTLNIGESYHANRNEKNQSQDKREGSQDKRNDTLQVVEVQKNEDNN